MPVDAILRANLLCSYWYLISTVVIVLGAFQSCWGSAKKGHNRERPVIYFGPITPPSRLMSETSDTWISCYFRSARACLSASPGPICQHYYHTCLTTWPQLPPDFIHWSIGGFDQLLLSCYALIQVIVTYTLAVILDAACRILSLLLKPWIVSYRK